MSRALLSLLVLLSTLSFAACDDGTGPGETTTLSLYLTDNPGDILHAFVTIEGIQLVGEAGGIIDIDLLGQNDTYTVDLLSLQNDVDPLSTPVTVPSGSYAQLRLIVRDACVVVMRDGTDDIYASSPDYAECDIAPGSGYAGPLLRPSFSETGIKVNLPGGRLELEGAEQELVLDWDVAQSFGQEAGSSTAWVMNPVVNAEDARLTGTLTVTLAEGVDPVSGSLDDFQAVLDPGTTAPERVEFVDVNGTWTATFLTLLPGSYTLGVELEDGVTEYDFTVSPAATVDVTVPSGGDLAEAFVVTSPPA